MATEKPEWLDSFEIYLSSALDPATKVKLKQEYIQWVTSRGNYYSNLKDIAPEFLVLLNIIEKAISVKVKIEGSTDDSEEDLKKDKKSDKEDK